MVRHLFAKQVVITYVMCRFKSYLLRHSDRGEKACVALILTLFPWELGEHLLTISAMMIKLAPIKHIHSAFLCGGEFKYEPKYNMEIIKILPMGGIFIYYFFIATFANIIPY